MRKILTSIVLLTVIAIISACGSGDNATDSSRENNTDQVTDEASDKGKITMGLIHWPENIAVNNVWKVILEEKGYEVDLNPLDMGTIMAALEAEDLDIGIEVWLPVQSSSYYESYQDTVFFAEEPWYENGQVVLVVPSYMDEINSIEDLNDHKDLFNGEIIGFEPGSGTMEVTEELIEDNNLDFELVPSSEPAMLSVIRESIKNEEAVVAPLWKPHGVFSELDLKFLEDPKEVYGEVEEIFLATRQGFANDFPEVNEWLMNWKVDDETMSDLMKLIMEEEDHLAGAKKWVEENRDLVDEWVQ